MGGDWSLSHVLTTVFTGGLNLILGDQLANTVLMIGTGGLWAGMLIAQSTIEGIVSGRMFSSVSAFLFEPLRGVCSLLGINDKDVTQGCMTVCKVFHENQYPDTLVKNCLSREKDGSDLMKYFFDFAKVGTAQFDKYYYTGKRRFIDALPDASVACSTANTSDIEKAIKADLGYSVKVRRMSIGYPDDLTWVEYTLQQQGTYDYDTDIVTINNKQFEIDTVDFIPATNKISVLLKGINGNASSQTMLLDPADNGSYIIATYHKTTDYLSRLWIHHTDITSLGVDFKEDDVDKMVKDNINCLPVACLRNNKVDVKDAADNSDASESFRNPKRYKQTKRLLDSLGLPIDEITKQYHENGDINDVYDAYFMAGICPQQTIDDAEKDPEGNEFSVEVVAKYLYKTIEHVYEKLPCAVEGQPYFFTFKELPLKGQVVWAGVPKNEVLGKKCKLKHYSMSISDSKTKRYKVILQILTDYIGTRQIDIYSYDSEGYQSTHTTKTVYEYKAEYASVELANKPITPQKILDSLDNRTPFFPDRVSANEARSVAQSTSGMGRGSESRNSYPSVVQLDEELDSTLPVYRIQHAYTVYHSSYNEGSGETETTTSTAYEFLNLADKPLTEAYDPDEYCLIYSEPGSLMLYYQHSKTEYTQIVARNLVSIYCTETVDQDLLDTAHVDDKKFIFPISHEALKELTIYDKTKLISEGFQMVFFAKKTQHLEFYETPEFGTFLQIVGVIITIIVTIFTFGKGTVPIQAAIQSLIQMVVIYVGVTLALQIIAAVVPDSTMKAILSAAVLVAAIALGGGFSDFNLGTAVQLAEVPVKAIDIYTKDQMKALQQEAADFQSRYQEAQKQVEQASGKLTYGIDTQDVLATQEFARSWDGRVMSREEFYTVTLTCPDLYSVCQDQIDRSKTIDLDTIYPLYDM